MKHAKAKADELFSVFVDNFKKSSDYGELIKVLKQMPEIPKDHCAGLVVEIHGVEIIKISELKALQLAATPVSGNA